MSLGYLKVEESEAPRCNAIHATLLEGVNRGIRPKQLISSDEDDFVEAPVNAVDEFRSQKLK